MCVATLLADEAVSVPFDFREIPIAVLVRSKVVVKLDRTHSFKLGSLLHGCKGTK